MADTVPILAQPTLTTREHVLAEANDAVAPPAATVKFVGGKMYVFDATLKTYFAAALDNRKLVLLEVS